jgi:starvation-inducible DNA-binding protein
MGYEVKYEVVDMPYELVDCLKEALADAASMSFKAHGHHWNVKGIHFSQFHDFFAEIYEDVHSSLDPLAENIQKIGHMAPYRLVDLARMTSIEEMEVGGDPVMMCKDLLAANEVILSSFNNVFVCADKMNEQGIADFAASRIDMHQKWRWQLRSYLTDTNF